MMQKREKERGKKERTERMKCEEENMKKRRVNTSKEARHHLDSLFNQDGVDARTSFLSSSLETTFL